ncbi:putative transmembrane protein [Paratrimastix pyriformis]|uniref:Transmembrane protein n=1 Tax=Paratrimastix pyriformis TaxID=342808 RepID=A0ABQ8UT44_9EUKA|nr:putative transmembrane protein [Paratrimastix pyriformis]
MIPDSPDYGDELSNVYELQNQLHRDIPSYLQQFDADALDEAIVVGTIDADEAKAQEELIERQRAARLLFMQSVHEKALHDTLLSENAALTEIQESEKRYYEQLARSNRLLERRDQIRHKLLGDAFGRSERHFSRALRERRQEVVRRYGNLAKETRKHGNMELMNQRLAHMDQPIDLHIDRVRAIKDKVPPGEYVLVVSMYDRLGGHIQRWLSATSRTWCGATIEVQHDARFDLIDLQWDQTLVAVCPGRAAMKPTLAFVFELVILRGPPPPFPVPASAIHHPPPSSRLARQWAPVDTTLAWGAFPVSDAKFDTVKGSFKVPLLRGDVNPLIEKYSSAPAQIEGAMKRDINNWLCNLYFSITYRPVCCLTSRPAPGGLTATASGTGLQVPQTPRESAAAAALSSLLATPRTPRSPREPTQPAPNALLSINSLVAQAASGQPAAAPPESARGPESARSSASGGGASARGGGTMAQATAAMDALFSLATSSAPLSRGPGADGRPRKAETITEYQAELEATQALLEGVDRGEESEPEGR